MEILFSKGHGRLTEIGKKTVPQGSKKSIITERKQTKVLW